MIELKNVCYSVFDEETKKEKQILKNINLTFPKGKVTCITGHNGSGKSTLVKLIMGILSPTSGDIIFDGENINTKTIDERAKDGISIAFQQPVRFKGVTVRDLMQIAIKGNPNFEEKNLRLDNICQFLSKVGLCAKDYVDREVDGTLSGGELKRIELALTIAKGGEVFLFDEPEAGIDLWSFDSLVEIFKELKDKTVIIVSHQRKVLENADYILLLNSNKDAVLGETNEVLEMLQQPQCSKLGGLING